MEKETKCTEIARITLPWGGKLYNYCPAHANQLVMLGSAMGSPIRGQLLPAGSIMECENPECLTEVEKELNKDFAFKTTLK